VAPENDNGTRLKVPTRKVRSSGDVRKEPVVASDGVSAHHTITAVTSSDGQIVCPIDELSSSRESHTGLSPWRETYVTTQGNTFDPSILLPGEIPDEVPWLEDGSLPAIVALRGVIMAVRQMGEGESYEEEVEVHVQCFPSIAAVMKLVEEACPTNAEEIISITRTRIDSAASRLVDLYPKGAVQIGAQFSILFCRAFVEGSLRVTVLDIHLDGDPQGLCRQPEFSEVRHQPLRPAGSGRSISESVLGVLGRLTKKKPINPWHGFGQDVNALSAAEAIIFGELLPVVMEFWNALMRDVSDGLEQLKVNPVQLTEPKSQVRLYGGRRLLHTYTGPSLFSDLQPVEKNIEAEAGE
jgi:hypothetical protein